MTTPTTWINGKGYYYDDSSGSPRLTLVPGATQTPAPNLGSPAPTPAPAPVTPPAPAATPAPTPAWGGAQTPPPPPPSSPFVTGGGYSAPAPSSPFVTGGGYSAPPPSAPTAGDNWMAGTPFDASRIPGDFNWQQYLQLNPALGVAGVDTETEAKRHYALYGAQSGASYKNRTPGANDYAVDRPLDASKIPGTFNWQQYLALHPDLRQNGIDTELEAKKHYALYGANEGRAFAPPPPKPAPAPAPGVGSAPPSSSFEGAYGGMYADLLSKINAWANSPYQGYQGDRVAGPSQAQLDAVQGIQGTNLPPEVQEALTRMLQSTANGPVDGYDPMTFSSNLPGTSADNPFGVGTIEDYMNPYIQQALDPQLRELQRQADLTRMADEARLTKAGAYGGSRQAILQGENNRNTAQLQSDVLGKGYASAYDKALEQLMGSSKLSLEAQNLTDKSKQFDASYGLDALRQHLSTVSGAGDLAMRMGQFGLDKNRALMDAGNTLWGIEQKGLDADYDMFKDERDDPINKLLTAIGAVNSASSSSRSPTPTQAGSSRATDYLSTLTGIMALIDQFK